MRKITLEESASEKYWERDQCTSWPL